MLPQTDTPLPDEIIFDILSRALDVADSAFADASAVSPFANYAESPSAYLLVCKAWLRVATPLLYSVVVLRSKAQAAALARALSGDAGLGQFIKKLRVEGGYGASMHTVLRCAPNVDELYLSLEIWSADSTDGLCQGFSLISPTRLIVRPVPHSRPPNKTSLKLEDAVVNAIPAWNRLTVFECPYAEEQWRADKLVQALVHAKRLHTVAVPSLRVAKWAHQAFQQCPLQAIQIKEPTWHGALRLEDDDGLKALLRYKAAAHIHLRSSIEPVSRMDPSKPLFTPMGAAPKDVPDAVWSRVLYFAMSVPERATDPTCADLPRRRPLLLVSKTFHVRPIASSFSLATAHVFNTSLQRLGVPHMHAHIVLKRWCPATHLRKILAHRPRSRIETIHSTAAAVPWDVFAALLDVDAAHAHAALRECHVRAEAPAPQQECAPSEPWLWRLPHLRRLYWHCCATFALTADPMPAPDADADVAGPLPQLEDLWILEADQSFLTLLLSMKLPSLRLLGISQSLALDYAPFLEIHGAKLRALDVPLACIEDLGANVGILDLCPNLCTLVLGCDNLAPPSAAALGLSSSSRSGTPALSLETLTVLVYRWPRNRTLHARWDAFFRDTLAGARTFVPRLREVHVPCFRWPTSERDIAASCWVRWAEWLLAQDVRLTDKSARAWRPRLQVQASGGGRDTGE